MIHRTQKFTLFTITVLITKGNKSVPLDHIERNLEKSKQSFSISVMMTNHAHRYINMQNINKEKFH